MTDREIEELIEKAHDAKSALNANAATPTTPPSEPPTEKEPIDEIIQFTERAANAIMDFMLADAEFRGWRPPKEGDRP